MIKKVGIGVAIFVAFLIIVIANRPAKFHIERSTQIEAPAKIVFPLINDFNQWRRWSPWENKDPTMKRRYSDDTAGQGATYSWSGNDEVGEGRMTITESRPTSLVRIKLEFIRPFSATNRVAFSISPGARGTTTVIWGMDGVNDFMAKAVSLFVDMDSMVGADFEAGLASLQEVAVSDAQRR